MWDDPWADMKWLSLHHLLVLYAVKSRLFRSGHSGVRKALLEVIFDRCLSFAPPVHHVGHLFLVSFAISQFLDDEAMFFIKRLRIDVRLEGIES